MHNYIFMTETNLKNPLREKKKLTKFTQAHLLEEKTSELALNTA